mmetsp:Transcript_101328/g.290719  ORF Transcript_101328/g.290719 Transcript_101328/m.290719 type:complete len:89 (-) Transcript_101328:1757-2023(-)
MLAASIELKGRPQGTGGGAAARGERDAPVLPRIPLAFPAWFAQYRHEVTSEPSGAVEAKWSAIFGTNAWRYMSLVSELGSGWPSASYS